MTVFFTGDLHLGDSRMLEFTYPDGTFCRPFASIKEHDDLVCDNWQDTVGANDTVYLTGDIAKDLTSLKRIAGLNGRKHLILGNHDILGMSDYGSVFYTIQSCVAFREHGFIATHRPIHHRDFENRFTHNVHAHVHGNLIDDTRYINTSLEATNMAPLALETILEYMKPVDPDTGKTTAPIDKRLISHFVQGCVFMPVKERENLERGIREYLIWSQSKEARLVKAP